MTEKPPGRVRGRPFPSIRVLQPEEEPPLQTRCGCRILKPASDTRLVEKPVTPAKEAPRWVNHLNAPEH